MKLIYLLRNLFLPEESELRRIPNAIRIRPAIALFWTAVGAPWLLLLVGHSSHSQPLVCSLSLSFFFLFQLDAAEMCHCKLGIFWDVSRLCVKRGMIKSTHIQAVWRGLWHFSSYTNLWESIILLSSLSISGNLYAQLWMLSFHQLW